MFEGARKSSGEKTGLEAERMALNWCRDERMMAGEEQGGRCGARAGRGPGGDSSGRRLGKGFWVQGQAGIGAQRILGGQRPTGRDGSPVSQLS